MKQKRSSGLLNFFLLLLLGMICVAVVELAVCRVADPALYDTLTGPAKAAGGRLSMQVQSWSAALIHNIDSGIEHVRLAMAERKARKEREAAEAAAAAAAEAAAREAAAQLASAPAVEQIYIPADPAITELVDRDGVETLTGGNVELPYFNQGDEPWASSYFGIDPIGRYGCGPTALAMAVSGLTGELIDPTAMAAWAADSGYAAPHSGAYYSIVEGTAAGFDLDCISLADIDASQLVNQLVMSDGVLVALMGPGHFTKSGHFILLHGVTLTGEILVADPNSRERSLTTWSPETLVEELSPVRANGAPLWLITAKKMQIEASERLSQTE